MACATVLDIPDPECPGHLKLCYDRVGDLANPGQNHKYTLLVSVSCYYKLVVFLLRRSGKERILHINGRDHEAVLMNVRKVTICTGLLLGSVCSGPPPPLGLSGFCKRRLENYMGIWRAHHPCIFRPLKPALSAIPS